MPFPTYPADLPAPVSAPMRAQERRDLTTLPGPRAAVPFQFAGQDSQNLRFRLSFAQSVIWDNWWRVTLTLGGAWFMAPWSHPTGETVPRRFITTPTWTLVPGYGWDVSIDAEVQSIDQLPIAPEIPLWLDNFTGPLDEVLADHAQDVQLYNSYWDVQEGVSANLDGIGNVYSGPNGSYAASIFYDFELNETPQLNPGWRFEMDVFPVRGAVTGIYFDDANNNEFRVYVYGYEYGEEGEGETPDVVTVSVGFLQDGFTYYVLPFGAKKIVVRTTEFGYTVRINGDVFDPVELTEPTTINFSEANLILGTGNSNSTAEDPEGKISRVALFGSLYVAPPPTPGGPLILFDPTLPGIESGFDAVPPDVWLYLPDGFNTDFNEDGELICSTGTAGRMGPNLDGARFLITMDARVTGRSPTNDFAGGVSIGASGPGMGIMVERDGDAYIAVAKGYYSSTIAQFTLPPEVDFTENVEVRITFDGSTARLYVDEVEIDSVTDIVLDEIINIDASQMLVEVQGDTIIHKASITYLPV